jgi:hypothetical protein
MAIQTRGFGANVMPQFVAANPELVAFNPNAVTGGVLSTIQIADMLAKRKAFLQQQAELEATRDSRLGAENARNQALISVAPRRALSDIALADKTSALAPSETDVGLAQNKGALADIAFKEGIRPHMEEAARIAAEAQAAAAPGMADVTMAAPGLAMTKINADLSTIPGKAALDAAKSEEELTSLPEDTARNDKLKDAKIALDLAQAEYNKANASYLNRDKPKSGNGVDELQKALGHVETSIQRLENAKVVNPNTEGGFPVPLIQYQNQVHDQNGGVLSGYKFSNPGILGSSQPLLTDPRAERNAQELKRLYSLRENLSSQLTNGVAESAGISVAPPPAPAQSSGAKVYTPAEAAKLPAGTVFTGTDGKQHVRK